ncbi:tyrosine-protein kinase Dnt isoform X2 [Oratosquilla oratoria]|uniref:tyrosine-protein kinase Dnt isoform X2 n=1 Tax=Oratosquilla oratoria TaxID=337810 RepID=UPI003F7753F7
MRWWRWWTGDDGASGSSPSPPPSSTFSTRRAFASNPNSHRDPQCVPELDHPSAAISPASATVATRTTGTTLMVLVVLAVAFNAHLTSANLNLYLPSEEVRRLLGLVAELYYVREGVINTYALNFTVPIPANFTHIYFTWQSLVKRPMPYMVHVEYGDDEAMARPQLNISARGLVPNSPQTFRVSLPCSGRINAEVDVNLKINITTHERSSNVISLTIKRRKICLKALVNNIFPSSNLVPSPTTPATKTHNLSEDLAPRNESITFRPEWMSTSLGTLYVAIGCACTFTVLVITVAAVLYLRMKKAREQQSLTSRYYSGSGYVVDSSVPCAPSLRSNSYVTIASFKKVPVHHLEPATASPKGTPLHYASSPVSGLYSQPYSPAHSTALSRHSHASHYTPSHHSHVSWRDPRQMDPSERMRQLAIDRWKVHITELLHEGTFGRVHRGVYHDRDDNRGLEVLIKTVSAQSSEHQARLVVQEGLLTAGLHHKHILPVLGVCLSDARQPLVLYPHLGMSNLKKYLLSCGRGGTREGHTLLTQDVVHMAIQACLGIMYLHKQRILHNDISTRNCMVDDQLRVRVSDTALSRDLFPQDYHCLGDNENRPVKWLALESLVLKQFSPASDGWMFGVLLWELITLAQQPYIEVDPFEMSAYLRDGYRLAQPHNCPDELFGMMACCWAPSPEERPSFPQLLTSLQDFYTALGKYI